MKRLIAAAAIALLLTGCSDLRAEPAAEERPATYQPYEAPEPEPAADIPFGFTDADNGLAIDWVEQSCSYAKCVWLELYAYDNCASGVYVEANVRDSEDVIVGYTNGTLSQLMAGQTGRIELTITESAGIGVTLTELRCR